MCRMFVYFGVQEWLFHHQEERVIQELREIHVHSGIANTKTLSRSCVWWACLDADPEPKCEPIPSVSQVDPQN